MVLLAFLFLTILLAHEVSAQGSSTTHPTLPTCSRNDSQLLLPDLIVDPPGYVRTALRGGRRLLEFETAVGNIGNGPLIIEGRTATVNGVEVTQGYQIITRRDGSRCARFAGTFAFHRAHTHWHFEDFVQYELRSGQVDGPLATTGRKASFCLLDLEPIGRGNPPRQVLNQTCNSQEGEQGISVGWKDVYDRTLPDQNLDLDEPVSLPKGTYHLLHIVDAGDRIWESDENNNRASVPTNISVSGRTFPTYEPNPTATATARPTERPDPRATPTRARPRRPDRAPRPTRKPARGTEPARTPTPQPTPTATSTPRGQSCPVTCNYSTQQVRFTWYDEASGGLNLSLGVRETICPTLSPRGGERGRITMDRWLTQAGQDTGRLHQVDFTMTSDNTGVTSDGGVVHFLGGRGGTQFTYNSSEPPIAGAGLGMDFPVVFNLCVTVGEQTFGSRLVCQEKPRGLLCHAG